MYINSFVINSIVATQELSNEYDDRETSNWRIEDQIEYCWEKRESEHTCTFCWEDRPNFHCWSCSRMFDNVPLKEWENKYFEDFDQLIEYYDYKGWYAQEMSINYEHVKPKDLMDRLGLMEAEVLFSESEHLESLDFIPDRKYCSPDDYYNMFEEVEIKKPGKDRKIRRFSR